MSVIRVGFVLGQVGWMGGVNYFRNLFTAIKSLPDAKIQPVVFAGMKSDVSAYEGLAEIIRTSLLDRYTLLWCVSKLVSKLPPRRDYLLYFLLKKYQIGMVSHFGKLWGGCSIPVLGWIPDFQHHHLPKFFDEKEIKHRNEKFMEVIRNSSAVLLSSQDALNDLNLFCTDNKTPTHILRFVSCPQPNLFELPSRADLAARYKLDRPWFHIPNQFWAHKNHGIVIEALHLLKQGGNCPLVIATGNRDDDRNAEYFPSLMKRVKDCGLQDDFRALGVLPYADVLALMKYSVAVMNPSLFEGWSTSVEESKLMGKMILLSDIAVHREQNPKRGVFFDPANEKQLAKLMVHLVDCYDETEDSLLQIEAKSVAEINMQNFARQYEKIVFEVTNTSSNYLAGNGVRTIFVNSLPKSGTHLIARCLDLMGYQNKQKRFIAADWIENNSLIKKSIKRLLNDSLMARNSVRVGLDVSVCISDSKLKKHLFCAANENVNNYILGHAPHSDLLLSLLEQSNIKTLFIIRDPRDVLVSWAHYIHKQPGHFAYAGHVGKSFEDRIRFILDGGYLPNGTYIESYANILRATSGWLSATSVMAVRFEDLVGLDGGGDIVCQCETIKRIAAFIGVENISPSNIASQIFGGTKTFRAGKVGGWRNALSTELIDIVNDRIAHLLPVLGYEK